MDLCIKIVIPKYDRKMTPETFLDWLACVGQHVWKNAFAHESMVNGHKATLVGTRFRGYVAIQWTKLEQGRQHRNMDPMETCAKDAESDETEIPFNQL